jgi:hypothetical protein
MSDELTPEEKAALESLPRERMPAGLEARVVGAMREHGFLAKRRRTIELTNGRVAGVLAAGVALMIGAYSIGQHRGGRLLPTEVSERERQLGIQIPNEVVESEPESEPVISKEAAKVVPEPAAGGQGKLDWELKKTNPSSAPPVRLDESAAPRTEPEGLASKSALEQGALQDAMKRSSDMAAPSAALAPRQPLSFQLGVTRVFVEAPDSVRIVGDERGRTLLIYTSDGVIRIYLDDRN